MLLNDEEIRSLIKSGALADALEKNVGPVSYDLTTKEFYTESGSFSEYVLKPGHSVFVGSREVVSLPRDLAARVLLRNSRIRQGLSLDAPLYFPGHKTAIYFRVTNVSGNEIRLDCGKGIAQMVFEKVDAPVTEAYEGAFSEEFDFRGMGEYSDVYSEDVRKLEEKADEIAGIEKRMYGNVLALMAIFAAIFSLVNVNLSGIMAQTPVTQTIVINLVTVGSFAILAALIMAVVKPKGLSAKVVPWVVALLAFSVAIAVALATVEV